MFKTTEEIDLTAETPKVHKFSHKLEILDLTAEELADNISANKKRKAKMKSETSLGNSKSVKGTTSGTDTNGNNSKKARTSYRRPQTNSRYFNEVSKIRCFNCGKSGHGVRECSEERDVTCYVCASKSHEAYSCPERICAMCNRQGHQLHNCNTTVAFVLDYTPSDIFSTFKTDRFPGKRERDALRDRDFQNIMCVSCFKPGHFNCSDSEEVIKTSNTGRSKSVSLSSAEEVAQTKQDKIFVLPWTNNEEGDLVAPEGHSVRKRKTVQVVVYCWNCSKTGHSSNECKSQKVEDLVRNFRTRMDECFTCGLEGHRREVCPKQSHNRYHRPNTPPPPAFNRGHIRFSTPPPPTSSFRGYRDYGHNQNYRSNFARGTPRSDFNERRGKKRNRSSSNYSGRSKTLSRNSKRGRARGV